jgi:hypothetical protein
MLTHIQTLTVIGGSRVLIQLLNSFRKHRNHSIVGKELLIRSSSDTNMSNILNIRLI